MEHLNTSFYVHPSAEVEVGAQIGEGTRIWRQAHVRAQAQIGEMCNIGKGVYVESHVRIGSRVKIQNHVSIFEGVTIEDGVFVGPHVCFTNDMFPRAITPDGKLKSADDWVVTPTLVHYGASIGAGISDCLWYNHRYLCVDRSWFSRDKGYTGTCPGLWQSCSSAWLCMPLCASFHQRGRAGW